MNNTGCEKELFVAVLDRLYSVYAYKYPGVSIKDVERFKEDVSTYQISELNELDNSTPHVDFIDPSLCPIIQSALAYFLHINLYNVPFEEVNGEKLPRLKAFHPNKNRYSYLDFLIKEKGTIALGSIKLYEFSLNSVYLDPAIFQEMVLQLIKHPLLRAYVVYFMRILQPLPEGFNPLERYIGSVETKPLKRLLFA